VPARVPYAAAVVPKVVPLLCPRVVLVGCPLAAGISMAVVDQRSRVIVDALVHRIIRRRVPVLKDCAEPAMKPPGAVRIGPPSRGRWIRIREARRARRHPLERLALHHATSERAPSQRLYFLIGPTRVAVAAAGARSGAACDCAPGHAGCAAEHRGGRAVAGSALQRDHPRRRGVAHRAKRWCPGRRNPGPSVADAGVDSLPDSCPHRAQVSHARAAIATVPSSMADGPRAPTSAPPATMPTKTLNASRRCCTSTSRCWATSRSRCPTNSPQDNVGRYADSVTALSVRFCSITTGGRTTGGA
jgi:hypothetical protein